MNGVEDLEEFSKLWICLMLSLLSLTNLLLFVCYIFMTF